MMKRTIKGHVKQVMKMIMQCCKECGRYYAKDSFCSACLIAEDSEAKRQTTIESRS